MIFRRLMMLPKFSFSEAIVQSVQGHKPPSFTDTPSGRYAGSLFTAASKSKALQSCLDDLQHFKGVLKQSSTYRQLLKNSAISRTTQQKIIDEFAPKIYHQVTQNFFKTVIQAGRLSDLEKIIDTYIQYCKILNKQQDIKVISAVELGKTEKDRVQASLEKNKPGVKFKITYSVDPAILGGLQIFAGTEFLDCSLRSRMQRLKSQLSRIA